MQAQTMQIQVTVLNGFKNVNAEFLDFTGFFINMAMPVFMNGTLKSTASSRILVIVNGATARSAF